MPEYIPEQLRRKEGYFPNTGNIVVELHRLLSIFLASRNFAELCSGYPGEGGDPIYKIQEVESDEITRILLSVAITARVIDDREGRILELEGSNCGTLQKDMNADVTDVLCIREACNKIIHADKVRFDNDELDGHKYLNPVIYLYGSLSGRNWRAQLDVIKFCKEYVSTVCHF